MRAFLWFFAMKPVFVGEFDTKCGADPRRPFAERPNLRKAAGFLPLRASAPHARID